LSIVLAEKERTEREAQEKIDRAFEEIRLEMAKEMRAEAVADSSHDEEYKKAMQNIANFLLTIQPESLQTEPQEPSLESEQASVREVQEPANKEAQTTDLENQPAPNKPYAEVNQELERIIMDEKIAATIDLDPLANSSATPLKKEEELKALEAVFMQAQKQEMPKPNLSEVPTYKPSARVGEKVSARVGEKVKGEQKLIAAK